MREYYVGIDIGSITVKLVVLDEQKRLLASRYVHARGRPRQTLAEVLPALQAEVDLSAVRAIGFTGSGGGPIARQVDAPHINELVAQTHAVGQYYPQARTVIEIGGQDSKLLILDRDPHTGRAVLVDFAMNTLCAAGTGSFLDQQAERLGVSIEHEFAALALQAEKPASLAGRCTVFAKSDMIHLQQRGVPLPDILSGLCYALARNFKGVIGRGKRFTPPILIQGGVASNQAVVRVFEDVLGLGPGELVIPRHHRLMAALGAALTLIDDANLYQDGPSHPQPGAEQSPGTFDLDALLAALSHTSPEPGALPPLPGVDHRFHWQPPSLNGGGPLPVYLGIDVGSISTNVVLIDRGGQVIARCYLRTAGRPLDAVRQALHEIGRDMGDRVQVYGVGVTGSGRYLTGEYVGSDVVRNEITSQARAAVALDPTVDTIFEIGGQDSKYIRLSQGVVLDFTMNKACAAGTGSFLEEQADKLDISVERDFGRLALKSAAPACLGERCTVFMESNLVHCQQQGAAVEDLTAGLAYSIAQNYLNRVVNGRSVGRNVFFQGGVASNQGVVAAFRQLTGARVTVPPHHDVTGAIGAAILAQERIGDRQTRFYGFDLPGREHRTSAFECQGCVNHCEITRVHFGSDRPLFYGARCERYDRDQADRADELPDFYGRRQDLLMRGYEAPLKGSTRPRIGIPRTLLFYDLFPYWYRFLVELGADVLISDPTNPRIVRDTWEHAPAETCFPVKLMQGHAMDLLDKGVDFLFLPSVVTREDPAPGQESNTHCPFIQAVPHLVVAGLGLAQRGVRVLSGPVYLDGERSAHGSLAGLVRPLGMGAKRVRMAAHAAEDAQRAFSADLRRLGAEVLSNLDAWERVAVLVGRSYNTCDAGLSAALPYKLRKMGVVPLPMDCLPLAGVDVSDRFDNMYWHSGQKILAAARLIRQEPRLQAIYLTSFGCGPDSFLLSYFRREMAGKLYLELELDDHTADAGVNTRCEAFFDSLSACKAPIRNSLQPSSPRVQDTPETGVRANVRISSKPRDLE
jgi:predicted CoA-substrate-specific enzyme activase